MYNILIGILKFIFGWKLDLKVEGQENIPKKGPALVIFNHTDHLDTITIMFSLPRKLSAFVAYDYRNNPLVMLFMLAGNVILVRRGLSDTAALKNGLMFLDSGGILVFAPEGTRGSTNLLSEGKYGAAYLAGKTSAKVVPMGISGTYGGYNKILKGFFKREKISVRVKIGVPFYLKVKENLDLRSLSEQGIKNE